MGGPDVTSVTTESTVSSSVVTAVRSLVGTRPSRAADALMESELPLYGLSEHGISPETDSTFGSDALGRLYRLCRAAEATSARLMLGAVTCLSLLRLGLYANPERPQVLLAERRPIIAGAIMRGPTA